jgi:hypothetical protein
MTFQPGQSGNPAGRRPGSRNKRTIAAERLFDETGDELTRMLIDLARSGHPVALKLCMDRVFPTKDRPVTFDLPKMSTAADAVGAMGSIVLGLADGDLTPQEALKVAKLVESFSKTISTAELERELRKLANGR